MSIESIARKIVVKHHDPEKAAEVVAAEIRNDKKLLAEITDAAVRAKALQIVYAARNSVKHSIKASSAPGIDREAMSVLTASRRESVLDTWSLSSGIALGDATKAILHAEAENDRAKADGLLQNVAIYKALADRCKGDLLLRESITSTEALKVIEMVAKSRKAG